MKVTKELIEAELRNGATTERAIVVGANNLECYIGLVLCDIRDALEKLVELS